MPVNKCVYIFAVGLLALSQPAASTNMETVWLKDVTTLSKADRRLLSDKDLPNELAFHLRRGSETLTLYLRRNYDINPNADFYFAKKLKEGQFALVKSQNLEKEDVAYYQDMEHSAFMTVRCVKKSYKHCDRIINGNIRLGDSTYDLSPAENDIKSRNLLEVLGHLGKQYVLRDESLIQRDILAERKDAAHVIEKKVEEELNALLRRFEGNHTENRIPLSDATLSSRNVAALRNRTAADIFRRQQKKEYHVKVTVIIDSGLWDFYSSMVPMLNPTGKRRQVMINIRKSFSHIMNGVNMLYRGIEDASISINVILSDIIVARGNAFPHKAKYTEINGIKYIEMGRYIKDAEAWDKAGGLKNARVFDTGILFTRYKLYDKSIDKSQTLGLTSKNGVCKTSERIVLVEARGLFWTVFIIAHELGHKLPQIRVTDLAGGYLILTCVEDLGKGSFRRTHNCLESLSVANELGLLLGTTISTITQLSPFAAKTCVTKPGSFYNDEEYMGYIKSEPGEEYSADQQCKLIIGRHSRCCEVLHCLSMCGRVE